MEIFSGFMVILSIFGFLLTVVWLILPFVVVAIKVKVDRSHLLLEEIDRRLGELERRSVAIREEPPSADEPARRPISPE